MPQKQTIPPPQTRCLCGNADCHIPYGYCHCGCGNKTMIASRTHCKSGSYKGRPLRFLRHHGHSIAPCLLDAKPFKIDGEYCRFIPLTKGLITIVSVDDYEKLSAHRWQAHLSPTSKSFYAVRSAVINGKQHRIAMHREILGLKVGDLRTGDHIFPFDTLDNRKSNLRIATNAQQQINKRKRKNNRSGFKGVSKSNTCSSFVAQIQINKKGLYLGSYRSAEDAYKAYCDAADKLHGKFKCLI